MFSQLCNKILSSSHSEKMLTTHASELRDYLSKSTLKDTISIHLPHRNQGTYLYFVFNVPKSISSTLEVFIIRNGDKVQLQFWITEAC